MPENSYCAKTLKSVITIVIDDNSPSTRDEMQCCKKCLIGSKNEMSCNLSGLIPMEKFEEFHNGKLLSEETPGCTTISLKFFEASKWPFSALKST